MVAHVFESLGRKIGVLHLGFLKAQDVRSFFAQPFDDDRKACPDAVGVKCGYFYGVRIHRVNKTGPCTRKQRNQQALLPGNDEAARVLCHPNPPPEK
jgi:hypothetical protein